MDLILQNVAAWALQVLILVTLVTLVLRVLRADNATLRLHVWHGVLVIALMLPLLQVWHPAEALPPGELDAAASESIGVSWQWLIAVVAVAGVAFRFAWLGLGLYRLRRLRLGASPWSAVPDWFDRARTETGVTAPVEVGLTRDVTSAVTFGLRRPSILVPSKFSDASEPHQVAVITHELHHVARRDWAAVIAEESVRALCWCHPAVWFAIGEAQLAREEVVDRRTIESTGNRTGYLEALVSAAEPMPSLAMGVGPQFIRRYQLKTRIRNLMKESIMSKQKAVAIASIVVATIAGSALVSAAAFPLRTQDYNPPPPPVSDVFQAVPPAPPTPPPPPPPAPVLRKDVARKMPPPPPPPPPQKVDDRSVPKVIQRPAPPKVVPPARPKALIVEDPNRPPPPPPQKVERPTADSKPHRPRADDPNAPMVPKPGQRPHKMPPPPPPKKVPPVVIKKGPGGEDLVAVAPKNTDNLKVSLPMPIKKGPRG